MARGERADNQKIGTGIEEAFFREMRLEGALPSSRPVALPSLRPGELLAGRFVIDQLVGAGGMAAVFRAVDQNDGRVVAVKVLEKWMYADRFAREAEILSSLSHPGIVRYIAHGTAGEGAPFLALEWLEGEELAQRLTRLPLSADESLRVVRRAAEAVAAAHDSDIVHRDIKPNNLFLVGGDPDVVKVFDFGVARLHGRALSQRGDVIGTPGYMAPEQALAEDDVDARADVFALACVLFECLTGSAAFVGNHPLSVLAEEPPSLSALRPDLAAVGSLLARALAKDRSLRPADAKALSDELAALERA